MNQTKKRLAIIKLAISMTDTETIQLQVLKLGLLKSDTKMQDIITALTSQNYIQAQRLISAYIESPTSTTVTQRTPKETYNEPCGEKDSLTLKEKIQEVKDKSTIKEFGLFTEDSNLNNKQTKEEEIYDSVLNLDSPAKKMSSNPVNYDALLNIDSDDVLVDNINLDISSDSKEENSHIDFFSTSEHTTDLEVQAKIAQDTFSLHEDESKVEESDLLNLDLNENIVLDELSPSMQTQDNTIEYNTKMDTTVEPIQVNNNQDAPPANLTEMLNDTQVSKESQIYAPISYIDQKLKNMLNQYPPLYNSEKSLNSVDTLLITISNNPYTEEDIENTIQMIDELSDNNKAEAAQLLLTVSATESKYAQFRLARALYQGELLQENLAESFNIINRLAMNDNYPEAICDLAQFYESGTGITKNKKRAKQLYKEAMNLGIQRAQEHYERLENESKGLLSFFKK